MSRILYAQRNKAHNKPTQLFEQFLVVGRTAEDSKPCILFRYPSNAQHITGIENFCFPTGARIRSIQRTPSNSSLYRVLCSQTQLTFSANSFVFLLTTETGQIMYGICVWKKEVAEFPPDFAPNDATTTSTLMDKKKNSIKIVKRCYCLVTRCPFFKLHFDFLYGILAIEHVQHISTVRSKEYEERDEKSGPNGKIEKITQHEEIKEKIKEPDEMVTPVQFNFNTDVVSVLEAYRCQNIPDPGRTLEFANSIFASPLQYVRPLVDEEEESLCDWALPMFFYILTKKQLFKLFTACLLERKIIFISKDFRALSSVVLSFIPLLRPFIYQSMILPVLPTNLNMLLEAPVPYLIGVPSFPQQFQPTPDVIIVYLDERTQKIEEPFPEMPRSKEFNSSFLSVYNELKSTFKKGEKPYSTTSHQLRLAKRISTVFERYLSSLFKDFQNYCIRDLTEKDHPVSVFMPESFIASVPKNQKEFYEIFLQTQMFSHYCDQRQKKIDKFKSHK